MSALERKAVDLRDVVEDILHQFRLLSEHVTNGPHVDLTCQELRVVEYLGDKGPRMMRELAEFLLLAVNSVTSTVDNLENKGMVERKRSDTDRRIIHVELTRIGKAAYEAAVKEKLALLRRMLGALTEDEQEIFMVLFRKIGRAGWAQIHKMAPSA